MKLGCNLMEKRVMKGLTQNSLCKELKKYGDNCNQCEISSYENGERLPLLPRLLLIAKVLGCKADDLYYIDEL